MFAMLGSGPVKKSEAIECAVRESRVYFPPLISSDRAIGLLQRRDKVNSCIFVNDDKGVENDQNLAGVGREGSVRWHARVKGTRGRALEQRTGCRASEGRVTRSR